MSKETPHHPWPVDEVAAHLGGSTELTPPPDTNGIRFRTDYLTLDAYCDGRVVITAADEQHLYHNVRPLGISRSGNLQLESTNPQRTKIIAVSPYGEINSFTAPNPVPRLSDYLDNYVDNSVDNPMETASPPETPVRVSETGKPSRERDPKLPPLDGNVAHPPSFKEYGNGKAKLLFHVATHLEDGHTQYHEVQVFNAEARRVQEQLDKGTPVQVIGYQASREVKRKDGTLGTKPYIRAAKVIVREKGKTE